MSERGLHGLDFGLDQTGTMRGIGEVERGLACNCVCPECGNALVARKGMVRMHYFAHRGTSCTTGAETALHRMARQIVAKERRLVQPGQDTPTAFEHATLPDEMRCLGRRPDVILWSHAYTLHVEVTVTHPCGPEKREEIIRAGVPTIELDLSKEYRRRLGWTVDQLTDRIVGDPSIRRWIHLPITKATMLGSHRVPQPLAPQTQSAPSSSVRISRLLSPFKGTLLVFDPWYGLVPREAEARTRFIHELEARKTADE